MTEDISCGRCGRTFTRRWDLARHMLTHTSQHLGHRCDACGRQFSRKDALKRHQLLSCEHRRALEEHNYKSGEDTDTELESLGILSHGLRIPRFQAIAQGVEPVDAGASGDSDASTDTTENSLGYNVNMEQMRGVPIRIDKLPHHHRRHSEQHSRGSKSSTLISVASLPSLSRPREWKSIESSLSLPPSSAATSSRSSVPSISSATSASVMLPDRHGKECCGLDSVLKAAQVLEAPRTAVIAEIFPILAPETKKPALLPTIGSTWNPPPISCYPIVSMLPFSPPGDLNPKMCQQAALQPGLQEYTISHQTQTEHQHHHHPLNQVQPQSEPGLQIESQSQIQSKSRPQPELSEQQSRSGENCVAEVQLHAVPHTQENPLSSRQDTGVSSWVDHTQRLRERFSQLHATCERIQARWVGIETSLRLLEDHRAHLIGSTDL